MIPRIYIYPWPKAKGKGLNLAGSPYVIFLVNSLSKYFTVVNKEDRTTFGLFNILKYIFRVDIVLFNWIEDVPDKKYGLLQTVVFFIVCRFLQINKKKIIWIMHNKLSHTKKYLWMKRNISQFLLNNSSLIITHSKEGIDYANKEFGVFKYDIRFIHHPMMRDYIKFEKQNPEFDILIWGKIVPYKGIDKFLRYLNTHNLQHKYTILLAGEIYPPEYFNMILELKSDHVIIDNRFIPEAELTNYVSRSRLILFTYNNDSVLSSAALMDSLVYKKPVLGPDTGAFKDLSEEQIVFSYKDFDDLMKLTDRIINENIEINENSLNGFISSNTWEQFSKHIVKWLKNDNSDC
jgi:beta-1,4-mannosyltransferase